MQKLTKKFGFFTALSMVIGIVVGSGVFYKAQEILITVNGNMPLGIIAWLLGGAVMLCCSATFAMMASMFEGVGGAADYAELCCSKDYAYYFSWFLATILYPSLASVLSWVSGKYVGALFGWESNSGDVMLLAGIFLIFSYGINVISPRIAGKIQISATIIKLIPLILMAIIGTAAGTINGNIGKEAIVVMEETDSLSILSAIVSTAFAYEGWIVATSINTELNNAKKCLPKALIIGGAVIISIYTLYYIGLAGALDVKELMDKGANAAFISLFGNGFGLVLNVFVCISCLGTLNGLTMATVRGYYVCGSRMKSSLRNPLVEINKYTDIPTFSGTLGLLTSALWLFYFYGANVSRGWFGVFNFDSSELPVITVYALYIPIFVGFIIKQKGVDFKKRFLLPGLSIIASIFIIFATIYAHGIRPYLATISEGKFSFPVLFYLIIFGCIMIIGWGVKEADRRRYQKSKSKTSDMNLKENPPAPK
jgi:APA family basic amino acid/polyamine antiporter